MQYMIYKDSAGQKSEVKFTSLFYFGKYQFYY